MVYILCLLLFMIGLYGVVAKKNIVKIVIGLAIMDYAINLFFILLGYRRGGIAPILDPKADVATFAVRAVDPLPQALVLTSIVISLGVTALLVGLAIRLYERYGTFDISEIKKLKG
ncbi:MAG: sodium:proton antiporter [Verrucomicrobiota bacterium]